MGKFLTNLMLAITLFAMPFSMITDPVVAVFNGRRIVELPQNAIRTHELHRHDEIHPPIVFQHNDEYYTIIFYYEMIGVWGDPDPPPDIRLFFSLSNDSVINFFYIGQYISGSPMITRNDWYDVGKKILVSYFLGYGFYYHIFLAVSDDNLYVYQTYADLEEIPKLLAIIKLN